MEIGVCIPNMGALKGRDDTFGYARRMEELGYDTLWTSDHIVIPKEIRSRYPYKSSGLLGSKMHDPWLEPVALMAALAGATERIRIAVSVLVIPLRNPVLNAKQLATIDALSNGRLIVGVGVGWMREEFQALHAPPYEERGAVTDEFLRIFKELCTAHEPSFQGRYYRFDTVGFEPKPVQKPHPPIWVGGITRAAMRRAARLGDGWHAVRLRPEDMPPVIETLHDFLRQEGRDPGELTISLRAPAWVQDQPLPEENRIPLRGSPQQVLDDIRRYEEVGVRHIAIWPRGDTAEAQAVQAEEFADKVMSRL